MSILFDNPPPAIGCGDPGDPIDFGLLTDAGKYLARDFGTKADTKKWTKVYWVKRWRLGELLAICGTANGGSYQAHQEYFSSTDSFAITINQSGVAGSDASVSTGSGAEIFYKDAAAWSQIHEIWDSNNPEETERHIITIDGVRLPSSAHTVLPALGVGSRWGQAIQHRINAYQVNGISGEAWIYGKHYLADFIFISGFVVQAEAFGYFNAYKQWVNRTFAGKGQGAEVYGASGFHLDFADPIDLGKDVSGNGNHFTSVGLTVDNQVADTPTNTFATLDPKFPDANGYLSEGNLKSAQPLSNSHRITKSTMQLAGKRYFEVRPTLPTYTHFYAGVVLSSSETSPSDGEVGGLTGQWTFNGVDGELLLNGVATGIVDMIVPSAASDYVCFATDSATGNAWVGSHSGGVITWEGGGDPEEGTSPTFTFDVSEPIYATWAGLDEPRGNFGATGFATPNVPPSFLAVNTKNMPCTDILNPDDYFTHRIKTGGESVSDLPFNSTVGKALVLSARMDTDDPCLISTTVNGAGMAWDASTNVTGLMERPDGITAFTPNGYSIGSDTAYQGNRLDLIWRASPKAGFDIVTINHTTGTPTTVPHFAGGVIEYGWCLPHSAGQPKRISHHRVGNDRYFPMHAQGPSVSDPGWISSTANTITLGASMPSGVYTLPVWRSVEQFSSFGRYAPNDSANGPFIPLDFSPRLFLPSGNGPNGMRAIFIDDLVVNGGNDQRLALEEAAVAQTNYEYCDFLSNGVKARGVYTPINYSDTDFYYPAAWARTPGKFARAR